MSKLKEFLEFCVEPEVAYSRDPLVFAQRVIEAIQEKASSLLEDEELFPDEDKYDGYHAIPCIFCNEVYLKLNTDKDKFICLDCLDASSLNKKRSRYF